MLDNIADDFLQRQADDVGHGPRQLVVIAEALNPTYRARYRRSSAANRVRARAMVGFGSQKTSGLVATRRLQYNASAGITSKHNRRVTDLPWIPAKPRDDR